MGGEARGKGRETRDEEQRTKGERRGTKDERRGTKARDERARGERRYSVKPLQDGVLPRQSIATFCKSAKIHVLYK